MAELNPEEASKQLIEVSKNINRFGIWHPLNEDELKRLLEIPGINVNLQDNDGQTALMYIASSTNLLAVQLLLAVPGIDVNLQNRFKKTALMKASEKGYIEIVKLLLTVPGITINLQDTNGDTALLNATQNEHIKIVKLLLAVPGIDVNLQNANGETALIIATYAKYIGIAELLLAFPGTNLNLQDANGRTALMYASKGGYTNIVRALLIVGADINIQNNRGRKAIFVATPQSVIHDLLRNPSASLMMGKTNRGVIDIPDDNKTNSIDLDDITDGETVVRIQQFGKDFFYRLENWKDYMNNQLKNYPRDPIKNPVNREIVTADQIDIFTAHIVPVVQNAPVVGSKRPRPANLRGGTRRRRITRRVNKKRATRRRRI